MSGHQGFVLGVGFSPDDSRLYSASIEGDIHVWDPQQRVRLDVWSRCHEGPILCLVVSDRGEVLSTGLDGTVAVWSPTGELVHRLSGHGGGVHGVAVTEDLIVSASADRRLGIWQRSSGELVEYLEGHDEAVTCVAFLDRQRLLSGSRDHSVRLWDLSGANPVTVFQGHKWWVTKVAPVTGGRFVSTSEDCTLRLWDPAEQEALWVSEDSPGPVWGLGIDPSGQRAVIGYGGDVCSVDLETRRAEPLPKVAPVSARAISFSSGGQMLALGADHGDVDVLDPSGGGEPGKLAGNGFPVLSGVVHSGLLVTGRVSGEVKSITGEGVTQHQGHDFFTYCCRYVGERDGGSQFISGGFDRRIRLWQPDRVEELAGYDHGGLIFSLAWDRSGNRVMAAGWDRISILSLPDLQPLWTLAEGGVGNHLVTAFTSEGRIAGVGERPVCKVWAEGQEVASHPLPDAHSCVIEAIPNESLVVVGSAYGRVSLVDVDSGDCAPLHGEHEDWIRVLRVSPDGQRILSISQNGSARVYDRQSGRVVDRFSHQPVAIGDFDDQGVLGWLDCLGGVHRESI